MSAYFLRWLRLARFNGECFFQLGPGRPCNTVDGSEIQLTTWDVVNNGINKTCRISSINSIIVWATLISLSLSLYLYDICGYNAGDCNNCAYFIAWVKQKNWHMIHWPGPLFWAFTAACVHLSSVQPLGTNSLKLSKRRGNRSGQPKQPCVKKIRPKTWFVPFPKVGQNDESHETENITCTPKILGNYINIGDEGEHACWTPPIFRVISTGTRYFKMGPYQF